MINNELSNLLQQARTETNLTQAQHCYEKAIELINVPDFSICTLNEYAYQFLAMKRKDMLKAFQIYQDIFQIIQQTMNDHSSENQKISRKTIAKTLTDYCDFLVANHQQAKAIEQLRQSLAMAYQFNDTALIHDCYVLLWIVQGAEQRFEIAQKTYQTYVNVEKYSYGFDLKLQAMEELAFCLWEQGENDQAIALLVKALTSSTNIESITVGQRARILTTFLKYLTEFHKFKEAQPFLSLVERYSCQAIVKAWQYRSYIEIQLGNKKQAFQSLHHAMAQAKNYLDWEEYIAAGLLLINFQLDAQQPEEAIQVATRLLPFAEKLADQASLHRLQQLLLNIPSKMT